LAGKLAREPDPLWAPPEAPYYGTFLISENAAWPTTAAAVFSAISEHLFWMPT